MVDRQAIFAAIEKLLSDLGPATFSTVVRVPQEVAVSEQPAIFLSNGEQMREEDDPFGMNPPIWKLRGFIYLYTQGNSVLQEWIDRIEQAFTVQRTLGGKVKYVRIYGSITTDGGGLGRQNVAIIRIEMCAV